jgi:hypothetical protein
MYGVGDQGPTGNLRVGVQTGRVRVALTHRAGLRALADDQPGSGPLGVVLSSELSGRFTDTGAAAGERSHHETVGELETPELVGREKICHGSSSDLDGYYLQPATGLRLPRKWCEQYHLLA